MSKFNKDQYTTDQANLARMIDCSDTQVAYLDAGFNFITANRAYVNGCGKSKEELIGKNHFDLFPNEENQKIFRMVRESGKGIEYHAKPFTFADQPERGVTYWDWSINPVKAEDGQVTGLVLSLKEVSEHYKIWNQSRKSAVKLMAYMAFTIFAADLLIMLVFRSFDENQPADFLFLDPFVLACFLLPILYFFFLRPLITNLTNTKQTKQILLQSFEKLENERKRLFSILDELPASVHLLRHDHSIAYRNRFFKDRFGADLKAPCYKILHGKEAPCHVCHAFNVFKSGKGGESEEIHANDHIFKIFNYPFTDIDGSALVLQLGIDLTKQKEYEKRLIQTEKLLTVAEMSAMISHEFRNSLTSVKMILELQCESQNLSSREKDSLSVVLSSIRHMEEIVTQLLNFSQPREKQFRLQNMNALLEECIDFTQIHMKKNDIVLEKQFNQALPLISLDKHYIKEAIVNFILNAIHAISEKGKEDLEKKIEIKTDISELPESVQINVGDNVMSSANDDSIDRQADKLVLPKGASCALITIKDTGIGIKESEIENIYNPFYTDKKQGGTGLGLAMVKRNINAHRGIVMVESEPQRGTVFKIYLPLASEEGERQSP